MKTITSYFLNKIKKDVLTGGNGAAHYDLIVFSHLRWEFVTQRPQHIISRIGQGRKVLFVEEPIPYTAEDRGTANVIKVSDNITVIQPRIAAEAMAEELEPIVKAYQAELGIRNPALWFYSASFLEMLDRVDGYSAVVYDCMDELSAFKGAPLDLRFKEQRLMSLADVVFTGGKSLYEAKKEIKEDSVYCFPSSVDRSHFEKALHKETEVPADMQGIRAPIAGYYGVIDERIDLELLAGIADAMPRFSFVMIGPVVKISESDLPRRANIHYLGPKPYEQLPNYLKAIDVAIMPFALNESTRFISPTKTLEFMAAGKAIVSTPITDVVRDYSETVAIAKNVQQFEKALSQVLSENAFMKKVRQAKQKVVLNKTSWDITAAAMSKLIAGAIERKQAISETEDFGAAPMATTV